MNHSTGFMDYPRQHEVSDEVPERTRHWHEFVHHLDDASAQRQAARCMDCGIPFCHNGCPVHNIVPDFNDLVYQQDWKCALDVLHSTNNFPEFTGRICPAPCEAACTLHINDDAVGIKSIERKLVDKGWEAGWIKPQPSTLSSGRKVAIVGSGPAGLAAAQQLARRGHAVTVFEKNDRIGGLLRYGIPDFKLEKHHIDRRLTQMSEEGVRFLPNTCVGALGAVTPTQLQQHFDAVVLAGGAEIPRDLALPGRNLDGVYFAMDFLSQQNRTNAGDVIRQRICASARHVVVIGGGDTGSDCVGTANRQGAETVTQLELLPQPPVSENRLLTWPYWPLRLRTSSSHEEGCQRDWAVATRYFNDNGGGQVKSLTAVRLHWKDGKMSELPDSQFEIRADLVLLALGFTAPVPDLINALGVAQDTRGNVLASTEGADGYRTSCDKVFVAGDMRRGQSLVVWAIREGRQCARAVDEFLMGTSNLPH